MLEFENTIHIERPIEDVYEFLANFENLPKWNYYVLRVRKLTPGPVGVGTKYHQERKTDQQTLTVHEFEPVRLLGVKTTPESSPQLEMVFELERDGDQTRLIDRWKLETGQPRLLEKIAGGKIRSAVGENLDKLKALLETGKVVLQDGRPVAI
jgi:uncharacterized protein YndB with AHSA1/START domain